MKDIEVCKTCKFNIKVKAKRVEYFCKNPYFGQVIENDSGKCRFYEDINEQSNAGT